MNFKNWRNRLFGKISDNKMAINNFIYKTLLIIDVSKVFRFIIIILLSGALLKRSLENEGKRNDN